MITILKQKTISYCLVFKILVKNMLIYYIISLTTIELQEQSISYNQLENLGINNIKSKFKGALIVYANVLVAISNSSRYINLEVSSLHYIALSLYLRYGFQLSGKRWEYYKEKKENCFLMTHTKIYSKNTIYSMALANIMR
nr:hypothetical protein [Erythrotrichia welwitschii]